VPDVRRTVRRSGGHPHPSPNAFSFTSACYPDPNALSQYTRASIDFDAAAYVRTDESTQGERRCVGQSHTNAASA
jgi:hypothetical protein